MEQMQQKDEGSLSIHAVPQKGVEQACFHALGLITRNCEYLEQHLAHTGADAESCQAVADIGAATAADTVAQLRKRVSQKLLGRADEV